MATDTTTPGAPPGRDGKAGHLLFRIAAGVAFAAAVGFTWCRLFFGMDLNDESYYVLIPWRWALGDVPFVNEQSPVQVSALLEYPLIKVFAAVRDYDVSGIMLYTRHLYLLFTVAVALVVMLVLRRVLRWELAVCVAAVYVTFIAWGTPNLSYNTMGAGFLTLGTALGVWVVVGRGGRVWALASGVAFGLSVVAYPTLLFVMPFYAICLALAMSRRAVGIPATFEFANPQGDEGPLTGPAARRALSFWAVGGAAVLTVTAGVVLSVGLENVVRSWTVWSTTQSPTGPRQLGGAAKAYDVFQGYWSFFWSRPYLLVAALLVYLVYRRWQRPGRTLLVLLPIALFLAGQRPSLQEAGFAIVYAFLAPYLYLFVPLEKRRVGAQLLIWAWAPAMIAGAIAAFTSAAGFINGFVGVMPALMASGVFLAWALEAVVREPRSERPAPAKTSRPPWLAFVVLVAIAGVCVVFQFQFQIRDIPRGALTSRFDSGPWWGISVTPERRLLLDAFAADLGAEARSGDGLLVFDQAPGFYLYWKGSIAANTYWMYTGLDGQFTEPTLSYYRRHRLVPTLVVHLVKTAGMSDAQLQADCAGLDYPPVLVRPVYAFQRKPSDETTAKVLARLPRR